MTYFRRYSRQLIAFEIESVNSHCVNCWLRIFVTDSSPTVLVCLRDRYFINKGFINIHLHSILQCEYDPRS